MLPLSSQVHPESGTVSSLQACSCFLPTRQVSKYEGLALETKASELREDMLKFPPLIINSPEC